MTLETANRLYELRKKNNLSQEELAEKLGVSRQAVSKWERSEASPDTDNLIALAKLYGLSLDELIYGEKKEKKEEKKEENNTKSFENVTDEAVDDEVYIHIEDDGDKVKIGRDGILVEDKDGKIVKINVNGKIMEKVLKKIENEIDDEDRLDIEKSKDEKEKTVFNIQLKSNEYDSKTKFWLEVPYPIICVIAYLLFGCYNILGGWALSWVIFITIPIYYTLVEAIYKRSFAHFAYPVLCTFIYLVCGLYYQNWHPSWMIFITIAVYYPIADALDKKIKNRKNSRNE